MGKWKYSNNSTPAGSCSTRKRVNASEILHLAVQHRDQLH